MGKCEEYRIRQEAVDFWGRRIYGVYDHFSERVFGGTIEQCDKWSEENILKPALEKIKDALDSDKS